MKSRVVSLDELNGLPPDEAVEFFLSCCGSSRWAKSMSDCRPFWNLTIVLNAAEAIWQYLTPDDWREALRSRETVRRPRVTAELRQELEMYETKFGYSFVQDPGTGGADDLLTALHRRLENPQQYEITVAAAEEGNMMRRDIKNRIKA